MRLSKLPAPSLATLTATVIATMLVLSVCIAYIGVTWYSSYLDECINSTLPPEAVAAYKNLTEGRTPDGKAVRILIEYLNTQDAQADVKIQLAALVCGLISALVCAIIGIYLARHIARTLEDLTVAARTLKSGDFSVRVATSSTSMRELSSLVGTFNALATSLDGMEERLRFNNMAIAHELSAPLTILRGMHDGVLPMDPSLTLKLDFSRPLYPLILRESVKPCWRFWKMPVVMPKAEAGCAVKPNGCRTKASSSVSSTVAVVSQKIWLK